MAANKEGFNGSVNEQKGYTPEKERDLIQQYRWHAQGLATASFIVQASEAQPTELRDERELMQARAQAAENTYERQQIRNGFIETYRGFIDATIKRRIQPFEKDEVMSQTVINLAKALETFDPDKARFATYIYRWILKTIQEVRKQKRAPKPTKYLSEPTWDEDDDETVADTIATHDPRDYPEEAFALTHALEELKHDYNVELNEREWRILTLRHGLDGSGTRTLREIAKELNISHEFVRKIELKALQKLKKATQVASPGEAWEAKRG